MTRLPTSNNALTDRIDNAFFIFSFTSPLFYSLYGFTTSPEQVTCHHHDNCQVIEIT